MDLFSQALPSMAEGRREAAGRSSFLTSNLGEFITCSCRRSAQRLRVRLWRCQYQCLGSIITVLLFFILFGKALGWFLGFNFEHHWTAGSHSCSVTCPSLKSWKGQSLRCLYIYTHVFASHSRNENPLDTDNPKDRQFFSVSKPCGIRSLWAGRNQGNPLNSAERFNPALNLWEMLRPMLRHRSGASRF